MPLAPAMVTRPGPLAVPFTYKLGSTEVLRPVSAFASWDGTSASGAFLPCLSFYDQTGALFMRVFPSTSIQAGGTADVRYAPFPGGMISGGGGMTKITAVTLTGSQQKFDITGIPQTYTHLMMTTKLRRNDAVVLANGNVTLNNLTGATSGYLFQDNAGSKSVTTTGAGLFHATGASADNDHFGYCKALFYNYSVVENDHLVAVETALFGQQASTATWFLLQRAMQLCHTPTWAINQITIDAGAGLAWVAGSNVTLYGIQ